MYHIQKKVKKAIVFGSGGARGFAHLGVWKILNEIGLKDVDFIAGTSMGAIIGAMYAQKLHVADVIKKVSSLTKGEWLKLFKPHIPVGGFIKGDKIIRYLHNFINVKNIQDLKIPFGCAAYNFEKCEIEFFTQGSLFMALRASFSIPMIFEPMNINDHYFLDGGLGAPLPMKYAKEIGAEKILVINVVQKPQYRRVHDELSHRLTYKLKKSDKNKPKLFEVAMRNVSIVEWEVVHKDIEISKPKYLLDIDTSEYNMLDFAKAQEIILLGENAALREKDMLEDFINE